MAMIISVKDSINTNKDEGKSLFRNEHVYLKETITKSSCLDAFLNRA